ncbi:QueC-like queuosine biosynthesis protein [Pseudomonas phage vB_PpuM-Pori-4]
MTTAPPKIIVAFSAGTDSTTAAYYYRKLGYQVTLAVFDDGACNDPLDPLYDPNKPKDLTNFSDEFYDYVRIHQEHTEGHLQFDFVEIRYPQLALLEANKTAKPGRDNAAAAEADGLGFWVGFKGLMAMLLMSHGAANGYEAVVFGHMPYNNHYEDELPQNFELLRQYMVTAYGSRVEIPQIYHPFYRPNFDTKEKVIELAQAIGVPLRDTYSCRRGEVETRGILLPLLRGGNSNYVSPTYRWKHCGTCENCVERKRAFAALGMKDPAPYMEH